ncbi:glutathione synthetase-like [Mya arenaria]|uniref:glutathione synthetase-like n=1 Tax=Mya arenaria TaxID=6604 RepID=UPI0022E126D1|nr:glutathione synthetase-like [Mya arenaria]XP_052818921.1 glutathione synthetase-like [Mya arenaria]XP_052818922.1 glutathione synthetase-like [Mya arenaria]
MSATALSLSGRTLGAGELQRIKEKGKQWAVLHAVVMRPQNDPGSKSHVEYAPMTLFPSPLPRGVLAEAKALQPYFNRLIHQVAHDHEYLWHCLHNVVKVDDYTRRLWDIYTTVRKEGSAQPLSLGLIRNDFMLDVKSSCCEIQGMPQCLELRQIEINTIASSFAGLASGIWKVHRFTMAQAGIECKPEQIPVNAPAEGIAKGLLSAWEHYGNQSASVLFVTMEVERNAVDQWWLESQLFSLSHNVCVRYTTLQYAYEHATLTDDKRLLLDGNEIAVIYYRDGYAPTHYHSEKEWDVRLIFERSKAIKCPSVHLQLAGCKKVQQELATPGAVERFIKDREVCNGIRNTFAGQYTLDQGPEGDANAKMAINDPSHYVLKPQREGGGNNIYGDEIAEMLQKMGSTEERSAYILMERIFPWPQNNHLLKEGKPCDLLEVISELGIYGVYLGSAEEELVNEEVGHLLRTKAHTDNEGGIVAGFATIDSPLIVEAPCVK